MTISAMGTTGIQKNQLMTSSTSSQAASAVSGIDSTTLISNAGVSTQLTTENNSSLSSAIKQALAQIRAGGDLASLFTSGSQQSQSDFTSSLLATLPGGMPATSTADLSSLYGSSPARTTTTPVTLDQSSPTIKLQTAIHNLVGQLDGSSNTSNLLGASATPSSGLPSLQHSFNSLITSSGGNPSQTSLQLFLKIVAANIQSSTSIGNFFSASA